MQKSPIFSFVAFLSCLVFHIPKISVGCVGSIECIYLTNISIHFRIFVNIKALLLTSGNVEALTYVKTNLTDPEHPTWPDIELIFLAGTPATDFGLYIRQIFNIPKRHSTLF
ncbi:unnamed protein product [Acanthoscelides obtectus]|uniref:Uncharacterized protein n=1 Tax=Acanthoscelides obtectus TaxID=200917 RepID=A0A9P0KYX7_ACAOB|nr:unnamed protein product [Acanthoscelides obtectus]CAK1650890.1 hypothetical protein AOBTE_LOCUS16948 [Acanthoscelides obtectus]